MKRWSYSVFLTLFLGLGFFVVAVKSDPLDPSTLEMADSLRQEKSYQLAIPEYERLLRTPNLEPAQIRELKFKLSDCLWRSHHEDRLEEAKKNLKELIESPDHDRWWAEANESLAQLYIEKDRWTFQNDIKQCFESARDYWVGSTDIALARQRFIEVSFAYGDYISQNWGWNYQGITPVKTATDTAYAPLGNGLHSLYREILKVTDNDLDKAKALYSLGLCYLNSYATEADRALAEKYLKEVIEKFKESEWVDDAYYQLGQYYERHNDFVKALETYQNYVARYRIGDSPWVNDAQERIKDIASPALQLSVGYYFLPGSEIQFNLGWRNVGEAQFTFYRIDLLDALRLNLSKDQQDSERGVENYNSLLKNWVQERRYSSSQIALTWKHKLKNEGNHQWNNKNKGLAEWQRTDEKEALDPKTGILAPGAYVLLVSAGGKEAYDLVMVGELGIVSKTAGHSNLFYVFDSKTGSPQKGAKVKYHYRYYNDNGQWVWEEGSGETSAEGLLSVPLKTNQGNTYSHQHNLFAVASDGATQAFTQGYYYPNYYNRGPWWLYAYSDRPAYRPNEEVSFKAIVRQQNGEAFVTPGGIRLKGRLYDPMGNQIKEAVYVLNDFGSLNDKITLDEKAPLGEYRLELWTQDLSTHVGNAVLFRLEEYKLPEFLVNIKPKPLEDRKQASVFKLGDTVTVELDAQYYFGGAVANAEVEYLIYQNYYYHSYNRPHEYEWYYNSPAPNYYDDKGQLVSQGKIKTSEEGKAIFSFETPKGLGNDLRYWIEARVVDQSRREIVATSEIKVMRSSYLAYLTPQRNLYRPSDRAEIEVKTLTANDEPVSVEGKITVKRNWWNDPVVIDAQGQKRNVASEDQLSPMDKVVSPGRYEETELFTKFVKTNERGEAVVDFSPERDGYYVVEFTGFDTDATEIKSSTTVYVCDKQSKDIGFRYGGLQIIAEKDTFPLGETARVMLVADRPDTWVLFSTEAEEIHSYQMVHMDGPVQLIEIPLTQADIPNVFFTAVSARDYQLRMHELPIVVPPEDKFLNVTISSDKEIYQPREQAKYDIVVTDKKGNPVQVEIGLGVTDASVYYIQSEYAPDIRQFFYGDKRNHSISTQTSFSQRPYLRLVRNEKNILMTEDQAKGERDRAGEGGHGQVLPTGGAVDQLASAAESGLKESESRLRGDVSAGKEDNARRAANSPATQEFKALKKAELHSSMEEREKQKSQKDKVNGVASEGPLASATVRTDFRSTVLWQPTVMTDANGKVTLTVNFPDSLTSWRATARAITSGTVVGNMVHETKTTQDIIVRLQAPRFFTERDRAVVSANVHNYTDKAQKIKVSLEVQGLKLSDENVVWIDLAANSEKRVDWKITAEQAGQADLTVMAQTETFSDAMKRSYPILPHGIEKFLAQSIVLKGQAQEPQSTEMIFDIPKERVVHSTSLRLILSPSLAAGMLDALPYLADYPYGCVEQTMSRFLPAVIVKKTMRDLGFSETDASDYIEHVLNPREDPKGHPQRRQDPTLDQLNVMIKEGLKSLYEFQHSDGGWGWWKEGDSDRFMSAYVVWGLSLAKQAGVSMRDDVLAKGVNFVQNQLVEEENNPDMLAWMLQALSQTSSPKTSDQRENRQIERLWTMREELNPYTRALFALSEHDRGHKERAETLARNLLNGMKEDKENGTVHWGESGIYYRFSEGGVEATAFNIKALANILPQSPQLEPAVKWMVLNRRGARWKNTRDTAIAILGLADYLKTTQELNPDFEYEITVNGKSVSKGKVTPQNMFTFDRSVELPADALTDGKNMVKVTMKGQGSFYVSGYLQYFTLEEGIKSAGNEMFVQRKYFREEKKPTLLKGYLSDWKPLQDGDEVKSGDRIKVEITLDAKNNYEYMIVEDPKPAGCEAVELKSGAGFADDLNTQGAETGQKTWIYQEFRDQKSAFFLTSVKQGRHRIQYELRAEVPGEFHGMPDRVHAMYVPEIRGNSDEIRVSIVDEAPAP